jgi:hypothetical protein
MMGPSQPAPEAPGQAQGPTQRFSGLRDEHCFTVWPGELGLSGHVSLAHPFSADGSVLQLTLECVVSAKVSTGQGNHAGYLRARHCSFKFEPSVATTRRQLAPDSDLLSFLCQWVLTHLAMDAYFLSWHCKPEWEAAWVSAKWFKGQLTVSVLNLKESTARAFVCSLCQWLLGRDAVWWSWLLLT